MTQTLATAEKTIALDKEGYLVDLGDWSEAVACSQAEQLEIELTPGHWEIIHLVRDFHRRRGLSPIMRILVKLVENELGADKGNSLYLLSLFPGSPARLVSKIAGLPRPHNCL